MEYKDMLAYETRFRLPVAGILATGTIKPKRHSRHTGSLAAAVF